MDLLLDRQTTASAKLIWLIYRLVAAQPGPVSPVLLRAYSGLSRPTVRKGLDQTATTKWVGTAPDPGEVGMARRGDGPPPGSVDAWVTMPGDLLTDRRIGAQGRVLYGILQWLREATDQFRYADLCRLTGTNPATLRRAVRELAQAGWLRIRQTDRLHPVRFSVCNPVAARAAAAVAGARRRLNAARFLGEALMREYLSLLVGSQDFEDDAEPGFLVNPYTDERMQLDRFYPPDVAFEFNGPQHYGATELFSSENAAKQRGRDYLKLGICAAKGIRLVVIHPSDLSLRVMQEKVGQLLPLRDLRDHAALIDFLEAVSRRYRRAARRNSWSRQEVAQSNE